MDEDQWPRDNKREREGHGNQTDTRESQATSERGAIRERGHMQRYQRESEVTEREVT